MTITVIILSALCLLLGVTCRAFIRMYDMLDHLAAGNEVKLYKWNDTYYVIIMCPSGMVTSCKDKNMYHAIYQAHVSVEDHGDKL